MNIWQTTDCDIGTRNATAWLFARGLAGIALMAYAFTQLREAPLWAGSLLGLAVVLLKGCPSCWGMQMAHALRKSRRAATTPTDTPSGSPRRRKPYQPTNMAEHLFPPDDVARFRHKHQA